MREERPDTAADRYRPAAVPLLTSKLLIPQLPGALVERERLHSVLDRGVQGPVTLLDAPAGWGKTVALSTWARAGQGPPVAWLSVEPGDEGPRFWRYLSAALDSAGVRVHLDEPGLASFLPCLADGLARQAEPVIVVLDDLHHVRDPEVLSGLDFLLRHAGPQLRLVVATRAEPGLPLHRWRLRGELTELGVRELSFTAAETGLALARYGLTVPAAQAAELHARAEGWPAGVRLAALGIAESPDPVSPVPPLSGEDPRIAGYLAEEVLDGRPTWLREAMVATSILDRMCAGLVEALTGAANGEQVLAELRRTNAFVVPLSARPSWYRYHRMFGDLLRADLHRQAPERLPDLHRRAAGWFAAHDLPVEALRHALAAQDWTLATSVLAEQWPHLVRYGSGQPATTPVPPPPAGAIGAQPELALAYAAERLDRHDLAGAGAYLDLADRYEHELAPDRRYHFTLVCAALRLAEAQYRSDLDGMRSAAKHLLDLAGPGADGGPDERAAVVARAGLGTAELAAGELDAAEDALRAGLAGAERTGLTGPQVVCASNLAFLLATRGELRAAERTARSALRVPPGPGQPAPVYTAYAHLALATVAVHWDRLDDAEANLILAAGRCGDGAGPPALAAAVTVTRAQLLRERGDLTGGYEALRAGRLLLGEWPLSGHLADRFAAVEADLRTARGDTATVRQLLDGDRAASPSLALALARAYLRDGNPGAAAKALPAWVDGSSRDALAVRLDAGLVEALAARRLGEDRRAARALERVLQLAEPEGFRRIFTGAGTPVRDLLMQHLDSGTAYWSMVSDLIAATGDPPEPDGIGPGEPLTERERTVLRYLQSILSNVEIATELSLSVNTVKTHVRNIYRKLAATGRRDAIRKARELRLL